jgi:hypothetical protein
VTISPARYHLAMCSAASPYRRSPLIVIDHEDASVRLPAWWCDESTTSFETKCSQVLHPSDIDRVEDFVENDCKDLRIDCGPNYLLRVKYYQNQLVSLSTSTIVNAGAMQQCWTCTSSQRASKANPPLSTPTHSIKRHECQTSSNARTRKRKRKPINRPSFLRKGEYHTLTRP